MAWTCSKKCTVDAMAPTHNGYNAGKIVYCSICSKMFLRELNPGLRCKCCNVILRQHPKKAVDKVRKYIL